MSRAEPTTAELKIAASANQSTRPWPANLPSPALRFPLYHWPSCRLDKPVSGLLLFARSAAAAAALCRQIESRDVDKVYVARVLGRFSGEGRGADGGQVLGALGWGGEAEADACLPARLVVCSWASKRSESWLFNYSAQLSRAFVQRAIWWQTCLWPGTPLPTMR
mgnify:CR=1 FL=1